MKKNNFLLLLCYVSLALLLMLMLASCGYGLGSNITIEPTDEITPEATDGIAEESAIETEDGPTPESAVDDDVFEPEATPDTTDQDNTPEATDAEPEAPMQGSVEGLAIEGLITGDVFYKDIAISRLFTEPFVDVLGPPLCERDSYYYYEGLVIGGDRGDLVGRPNMVIILNAYPPILHLFDVNGVVLAMSKTELITDLGYPLEYYENPDWANQAQHDDKLDVMSYEIINPEVEYRITLVFSDPDDFTVLSYISMGIHAKS